MYPNFILTPRGGLPPRNLRIINYLHLFYLRIHNSCRIYIIYIIHFELCILPRPINIIGYPSLSNSSKR